jgi:corrinoid protein of di/trimethylamine methyltransferase
MPWANLMVIGAAHTGDPNRKSDKPMANESKPILEAIFLLSICFSSFEFGHPDGLCPSSINELPSPLPSLSRDNNSYYVLPDLSILFAPNKVLKFFLFQFRLRDNVLRGNSGPFRVEWAKKGCPMDLFKEMAKAVIEGDEERTVALAKAALEQGVDPAEAIEKGLAEGMKEVGKLFEKLEVYLPQVIISADAMTAGVDMFRQHLVAKGGQAAPKTVLLGTIQGDVHDIGKNIVKIMLESNGFKVYDLGRDVPVLDFIEKVKELGPDIIGVSALMTTTMVYMPKLIEALKENGLREKVKVMVGGAPVLPEWAKKIGADGYGASAAEAVRVAKMLIGLQKEGEGNSE